ncbi:protein of unknown function [Pseudodesulfovibrio profundus]|uniref:Uncharacterized protein n=1 Tax=Pseudodesulfovibrio profundus TaxID=57320 RepID=A0A2C8FDC0_9BACT|nr:hypothetical protein [Pseudodesulfovibrio profundus]SOB60055.1 protein of unknown function [Pseudodesulfovibrio profundus]
MTSKCTLLRRADVRLDPDKLQRFVTSCVTQGDCLADVFLTTRIYLEMDGQITLEFLPDGGGFHFVTFEHDEWSPAETASRDALRLFRQFRPAPTKAEVYDLFTGQRIDPNKKEERFGEKLRQKIEELEQNAF